MPKATKNNYSVSLLFFNSWVILMRVTCILFLIIQSQLLGPNFTVYCVAIICLANPLLSNLSGFRKSQKHVKRLWAWLFLVSTTSIVALLWGYTSLVEESQKIAQSFLLGALEATVIILLIQSVIIMVQYFSKRRNKRKSIIKN